MRLLKAVLIAAMAATVIFGGITLLKAEEITMLHKGAVLQGQGQSFCLTKEHGLAGLDARAVSIEAARQYWKDAGDCYSGNIDFEVVGQVGEAKNGWRIVEIVTPRPQDGAFVHVFMLTAVPFDEKGA